MGLVGFIIKSLWNGIVGVYHFIESFFVSKEEEFESSRRQSNALEEKRSQKNASIQNKKNTSHLNKKSQISSSPVNFQKTEKEKNKIISNSFQTYSKSQDQAAARNRHHSRARIALGRLHSLQDLIIYKEILSKPKGVSSHDSTYW